MHCLVCKGARLCRSQQVGAPWGYPQGERRDNNQRRDACGRSRRRPSPLVRVRPPRMPCERAVRAWKASSPRAYTPRTALGHSPPPAARIEAASLAGEWHEALKGAVATPKPREAMGQHSTRKELAKLLLDEAGASRGRRRGQDFPEEGFQVLADDGVEDGVLGVAGPIRAVGNAPRPGVAHAGRDANAQRWIHRFEDCMGLC
jgi:hypothetical protein